MVFTNYNMKCLHCGVPVDYEEQVYCEDCEEEMDYNDDYEDGE